MVDSELILLREEPGKSQPVTMVTSAGTVKQPKLDLAVTTLTPAVEGGRKLSSKKNKTATSEKRSLEEPEVGYAPLPLLTLRSLPSLLLEIL